MPTPAAASPVEHQQQQHQGEQDGVGNRASASSMAQDHDQAEAQTQSRDHDEGQHIQTSPEEPRSPPGRASNTRADSSHTGNASQEDADTAWHALTDDEALRKTESSKAGLRTAEVKQRAAIYGPNRTTPAKRRTILHMIWDQLYNIVIAILVGAAVVAGIFEQYVELGFILAVIVANVIIGTVQEGRAESATRAISSMVAPTAQVIRSERKLEVLAEELVPGDIVMLGAGDSVPADMRLLQTDGLRVVEAALTGESSAVTKKTKPVARDAPLGDRTCMVYMGTLVIAGEAQALVVATGDRAEIGRISTMVAGVKTGDTPLQRQITHFGRILSIGCIVVVIVTFVVAYVAHDESLQQSLGLAVSVAVALIPEGLPTVVTITLALGVQAMAKHNAIIRQLPAVETLGSITCICADKTGTLTRNEMTTVAVCIAGGSRALAVTGQGYNPYGVVGVKKEWEGKGPKAAAEAAAAAATSEMARRDKDVSSPSQNENSNRGPPEPARESRRDSERPWTSATDGRGQDAVAEAGLESLTPEEVGQFRILILSAALCNDASVMPVVSRRAQELLHTQTLGLSFLSGEHTADPDPHAAQRSPVSDEGIEWDTTGEPTEAALLVLAMKAGLNYRTLHELYNAAPRVGTIPFNSENKFMATVHDVPLAAERDRTRMLLVKGAADVLLDRCATQAVGMDPTRSEPIDKAGWERANAAFAHNGMRVLALCQRDLSQDGQCRTSKINSELILGGKPSLQLNALVAIVDPPRLEVIDSVRSCHTAGIVVKMITGDHAETAHTIGKWIGIETNETLTGTQVQSMSEAELRQHAEGCNIYARMSPEHKLRIVRALQAHGHVVAMTGDGVNDAPALRQANVGVAMGSAGTAVARDASRMVLQDDNFATIEVAVRLGRSTYDNLRKLILFILPTTIAQGGSVALAVFFGIAAPLTQVQILFVNMVTAATLGVVLAAEGPEPGIMDRPPRRVDQKLVDKYILWRSCFVGAALIAAMLGQQAWTRSEGGSHDAGHTVAMNTLVVGQCLYCLSCRFLKRSSIAFRALKGNNWLLAMIALNLGLQAIITYVPVVQDIWGTASIGVMEWLRILLFAVGIFLLVEFEKCYAARLTLALCPSNWCGWCPGRRSHLPQPFEEADQLDGQADGESLADLDTRSMETDEGGEEEGEEEGGEESDTTAADGDAVSVQDDGMVVVDLDNDSDGSDDGNNTDTPLMEHK